MSSDLVAVLVGDQLMLARKITLDDGSTQYRNKFGLALDGAKEVDGESKPKAAKSRQSNERVQGGDAPKRQSRARKGAQSKKPQASSGDSAE